MRARDRAFQQHTKGKTRYFTYYLIFPVGSEEHRKADDTWCAQIPFIHDLQFQLKQTKWANDPIICGDLIRRGETKWRDHNGVTHRIVVEDVVRPKRWGINRHAALPGVTPGGKPGGTL